MQPRSDPNATPKALPELRIPDRRAPEQRSQHDDSRRQARGGPPAAAAPAQLPPPPPYAEIARPLPPDASAAAVRATPRSEAPPAMSYTHALFDHEWSHLGLPSGYFLLRNAAQGKTLDLVGHRQDEGAELGLHPVKQPLLEGVSLQHKGNNQLFFLSWDGHLVAGASSRPVDAQDSRLVQAYPHPVMTLPSRLSHPLPRFQLDPDTSTLHVRFQVDPSFRGDESRSADWRGDDFIVEAVPRKRRSGGAWASGPGQVLSGIGSTAASIGERLGALGIFSRSAESTPQTRSPKLGSDRDETERAPSVPARDTEKIASTGPPRPAAAQAGPSQVGPSSGHAVPAQTGVSDPASSSETDDSDSDDEPSAYRPVRIVRLKPGWRETFPAVALRASPDKSFGVTRWSSSPKELRKWRRRRWEVIPVQIRSLPPPDFPVPSPAGPRGEPGPPRSATGSVPRSASDAHAPNSADSHYPSGGYAMADYFGIGSHDTSAATSPDRSRSRSRRVSHDHNAPTSAVSVEGTSPIDARRWSATAAATGAYASAAASHLSGLISSRLALAAGGGHSEGELVHSEGIELPQEREQGTGTGTGSSVSASGSSRATAEPRAGRDGEHEHEWDDARMVSSRELDRIGRERQSSSSASASSTASEGGGGASEGENSAARETAVASAPGSEQEATGSNQNGEASLPPMPAPDQRAPQTGQGEEAALPATPEPAVDASSASKPENA